MDTHWINRVDLGDKEEVAGAQLPRRLSRRPLRWGFMPRPFSPAHCRDFCAKRLLTGWKWPQSPRRGEGSPMSGWGLPLEN